MNKRFLSTLLTGAIFLAATSMFVSCKDYDDDIKNLQAQIDKAALKADLEALQTKLSQVEATANAAATKAELEAVKTDLSGVKATAEKAASDATKAISDAAKAQSAADAAQAFAETVKITADAAKALAENAATKDELATAKKELKKLADDAQATANAAQKLAEAAATQADFDEAVKTLTEAAANAQKTASEAKTLAEAAATKVDFDAAVAKLTEMAKNAQADVDALEKIAATKDELAAAKKELKEFAENAAKEAKEAAITYTDEFAKKQAEKDAAQDATIKKIMEDYATNATVSALATELKGEIKRLEGDIDALEAADKATAERIDQIVKNYDAQIANLFSAVTSVSLYVSGLAATSPYQEYFGGHAPALLLFPYATEFDNVFPSNDKITDKQYTFKKGTNSTLERSLMVRVSPTNAVLSADMITLINSKGEAIPTSLIETVEVEPYEELLTMGYSTRGGAVSNSGLWTVTFKLKDGFAEEDLAAVAENDSKNVVFAVAVNNTPEDADARLVVSEYDVLVDAGIATPAYAFNVNDAPVANIHNRWQLCDDATSTMEVAELNWKYGTPQNPVPAVKATEANSGDRVYGIFGNDNRQNNPILGVACGEEITIEFPELDEFKAIRGFYVTLDQDFALESDPSEINAWTSYEYENVGYTKTDGTIVAAKMQDGNKGTIAIKDLNNVKGDIIGFRVYAVNLDGTLYDPDGRAFYVKVGNSVEDKTIEGVTVTISTQGTSEFNYGTGEEIFDIPEGTFSKDVTNYFTMWGDKNPFVRLYGENEPAEYYYEDQWQSNIAGVQDGEFYTPVKETPYFYTDEEGDRTYYDEDDDYLNLMADEVQPIISLLFSIDGKEWYDINYFAEEGLLDKITKGKAIMNHANRLLDNGTYHIVLAGLSEQLATSSIASYFAGSYSISFVERVHFYITKALPEFPAGLTKKKDQLPDDVLTVWMKPATIGEQSVYSDWTVANKEGNMTNAWARIAGSWTRVPQFYGQDIHPYDLADIFNMVQNSSVTLDGQVIPSFLWKFNASDKANGKEVPTYSAIGEIFSYDFENGNYDNYSYYNVPNDSYYVPFAEESFINDGKKKNVDADYIYYNISLTQQRVAGNIETSPLVHDWMTQKLNVFQVEYKCVMDGNFSMDKKWKGEFAYEDDTYTIDLDSVLYTPVTLPSYILPEKTGIEEKTLGELLESGKLVLTGATIDNTDYFEVNPELDAITLQSTRSIEHPSLDKDQKFTVTAIVTDVFGHEFSIAIPVVMKKPVQSAPRL